MRAIPALLLLLVLLVVAAFTVALPAPSCAQDDYYGTWDVANRGQLSINGGYLWFTQAGDGTPNWRGVDLGGSATWSLHPRLSVFGNYSHGFPLEETDGHTNFMTAAANLRITPPGPLVVGIGTGLLWMGEDDVRAWKGYDVHIVGARMLNQSRTIAAYAKYAHAFPLEEVDESFDFLRAGLTWKLYGR